MFGGCVMLDGPNRLCIICGWPGHEDWNAFDGPRSAEFDFFQPPVD